jgi:hypothetical protein
LFEYRVLGRILGSKGDEVTGNGENYIMRSFMICILSQYCSGDQIEKYEVGRALQDF